VLQLYGRPPVPPRLLRRLLYRHHCAHYFSSRQRNNISNVWIIAVR
jgi:hypothetical protein